MEINELRGKIDFILGMPDVKRVIEIYQIGEVKSNLKENQNGFCHSFSNTTEDESRIGFIRIGIDERGYFISFNVKLLKGPSVKDEFTRFVYDPTSNIEVVRNKAVTLSLDGSCIMWAHRYERDLNHIHLAISKELWGIKPNNVLKKVVDLTKGSEDIATLTGAESGLEYDPKEDAIKVEKRLKEKLNSTCNPEGCRAYCNRNVRNTER